MESLMTNHGVLLRDDRGCALFLPETMKLYALDLPRRVQLAAISDWLDTQMTPKPVPQTKASADDALNLSYREAMLPMMASRAVLDHAGIRPKINRLTLNISNACNLFCSYCYADYGLYHSPRSYMPVDRALEIVDRILTMYGDVDIVHYFGGEPLLNPDVIDAVSEAFHRAYSAKRIKSPPKFVATTNGTISAKRIIDLLKKWDIELTVSWDGPKPIHDRMRPMVSDKLSSYDKLIKTTDTYRDNGIPFEIECTYNAAHIQAEVSVVDLMDFFQERTGLTNFHIAPVCLPSSMAAKDERQQHVFRGESLTLQLKNHISVEDLMPLYRAASAYTVDNMFAREGPQLTLASAVVEQICKQRKSSIYCPAFFNQLSIATDGTAYPCFMFIGDKRFNLGNILTDAFPTKQGHEVFRTYFEEFGLSPMGTDKWFAPLFSGCVAGEFIASNSLNVRTMESLYREIIEECLLGVALYSDRGAIISNFGRARAC